MVVPNPIPIYRIIHISNLETLLRRHGLHAPNFVPSDGLEYRCIHNEEIQAVRHTRAIPVGPGGTLHDYVPFYFGTRQPMLFQLKTGYVLNYNEGQDPIIYLISSVQKIVKSGLPFVFSDGHGIAEFTDWYDCLESLENVDWEMVNAHYWADTTSDLDRQRRKQAEFLIHKFCPWSMIEKIVTGNQRIYSQVNDIMNKYPEDIRREVAIEPSWYY